MSKYYTLKIKELVKETADSITIKFKQPFFKKVKYIPGQFLTLLVTVNGQKLRRSYSMSSAPNVDKEIAVTVKRVENGVVSNYLNDNLKEGDSLEVMEAMGHFTYKPKKDDQLRHVILFGAGSGITPLYSILKTVLFDEKNTRVSLVFGNRNEESIIFKKEIESLQAKFKDRFTVVHVLSQPSSNWAGYTGRVDQGKVVNITNLLPKLSNETREFYTCGPDGFMTEVLEGLKFLKIDKNSIKKESFTATASTEAPVVENEPLIDRTVKLIFEGTEHTVHVPSKKTILEAGLDAGIDMPFSCQSGLCTACRSECKTGKVIMNESDALSPDEIKKGYVLTCISHAYSDDVVIEVGV